MRILFLACMLCVFQCAAQDSTKVKRWSVYFKPLGAVDPFLANYTFGLQYKAKKRLMLQAEAGWIKTYYYDKTQEAKNIFSTGFRVGAEVKYFLVKGFYVAVQGFYNDYVRESEEYVWRYAQTYQQELKVKRSITAIGGHVKAGYKLPFYQKKFFADFYGGIGCRRKEGKINDLPDDAILQQQDGFTRFDFAQTGTYASVTLGVGVGYTF